MPIHERFDVELWRRRLPFDRLYSDALKRVRAHFASKPATSHDPSIEARAARRIAFNTSPVDGPRPLLALEHLRERPPRPFPQGPVPVDVFVWARGEAQNRACTKIAGVPYRPDNYPWPVGGNDRPMDFLAQFCFADSQDIARMPGDPDEPDQALPGDVLLIFCDGEWISNWNAEPEAVHFEWWPLGLANLIRAEQVPPRRWLITPTHGQLHRTVEYHDPPDAQHSLMLSSWTDEDSILRIDATKIGGIPFSLQDDPNLPGRHLCALASLNPFGGPWPLLNVETNPRGEAYLDHALLMFGDVGQMNISIDEDGGLHWGLDCG